MTRNEMQQKATDSGSMYDTEALREPPHQQHAEQYG